MKKIPTIFRRNPENMKDLLDEPNPECQWVFDGEGVATRKYDGTCCKVEGGLLYKRREVKPGKSAPEGFVQEDHDEVTGKTVGWVLVDLNAKENRWHEEAFANVLEYDLGDGTCELLGPKIQGNPEGYGSHALRMHKHADHYLDVPRTYEGIRTWLIGRDIEGLVFHTLDGRMAKIKKKDFGLSRQE